ncbi:MAG: polysaccharide biosynthesis C-terminal domain-containing protein [Sedimentisphaerales bacterium]|nr:polysaccharide biosynthesis C-terminal domain-containing protein [Sedimentisphaerales bacterium]
MNSKTPIAGSGRISPPHDLAWRLNRGGGSLSRNTVWAVAGNVILAAGRFGIFVLLWKRLPSGQVGQVLLALAIVTPLSLFLNLGLRLVLVTDAADRVRVGHCLMLRWIGNGLLMVLLAGLCLLAGSAWPAGKIAVVLLAGAVRCAENWADIYLAVLQKHERMKNVTISQVLKVALVLLWTAIWVFFTSRVVVVLIGWCLSVVLVGWLYDRPQAARREPIHLAWDAAVAGRLIRWGIPLGLFITVTSLNERLSLYFLERGGDDRVVAHFGTLLYLLGALATVQNGVNQAILPRLAVYFTRDRRGFLRLLGKILLPSGSALILGVLLVWVRGEWILRMVARPEYARYADLFGLVMIAGFFLLTGMILGDALLACHRFSSRMLAVLLGLAVNFVLCVLLIPGHGPAGAAWAILISSVATMLACAGLLGYALRVAPGKGTHA